MGKSTAKEMAQVAKLLEIYAEEVEDLANEVKKELIPAARQLQSSDVGEELGKKVEKKFKSHLNHVRKGRYKEAGIRLEEMLELAEEVK